MRLRICEDLLSSWAVGDPTGLMLPSAPPTKWIVRHQQRSAMAVRSSATAPDRDVA